MNGVDAAHRWALAWKDGWEALDPEPIMACYAPDALLSTEPFREPYRGLDAIRSYVTSVLGEEGDPRVWMGEPLVEGERAAVSWWASLIEEGADTTLAGTSVLRFDRDGLAVEQWDTWNRSPERTPPPEWAPFPGRDP